MPANNTTEGSVLAWVGAALSVSPRTEHGPVLAQSGARSTSKSPRRYDLVSFIAKLEEATNRKLKADTHQCEVQYRPDDMV
jgi:hypothetical protein